MPYETHSLWQKQTEKEDRQEGPVGFMCLIIKETAHAIFLSLLISCTPFFPFFVSPFCTMYPPLNYNLNSGLEGLLIIILLSTFFVPWEIENAM